LVVNILFHNLEVNNFKKVQGKGFEHSLERFFFFVTLIIYLIYLFFGKGLNPQTFLDAPEDWGIIWQVVTGPPITKVEAQNGLVQIWGCPCPQYCLSNRGLGNHYFYAAW